MEGENEEEVEVGKKGKNLDLKSVVATNDLQMLHASHTAELGERKPTIHGLIDKLDQLFAIVDDFRDFFNPVDALEGLGTMDREIMEIMKRILAVSSEPDDDVEEKWMTALYFSKLVIGMIDSAQEYAFELDNGSEGDWCPKAAASLENFWLEMINGSTSLPSAYTVEHICEELDGSLGDYENDLGEILNKIRQSAGID
jgi:hypothetical protein